MNVTANLKLSIDSANLLGSITLRRMFELKIQVLLQVVGITSGELS